MLIELNFAEETFANSRAWLWHHPESIGFCCGIDTGSIVIRFDDIRLFKAIVVQQNIPVLGARQTGRHQVTRYEIDTFIEKYHPEKSTQQAA